MEDWANPLVPEVVEDWTKPDDGIVEDWTYPEEGRVEDCMYPVLPEVASPVAGNAVVPCCTVLICCDPRGICSVCWV